MGWSQRVADDVYSYLCRLPSGCLAWQACAAMERPEAGALSDKIIE